MTSLKLILTSVVYMAIFYCVHFFIGGKHPDYFDAVMLAFAMTWCTEQDRLRRLGK